MQKVDLPCQDAISNNHDHLRASGSDIISVNQDIYVFLEKRVFNVEAFLHMVRERTEEQLDAWLSEAEASHLEVFESFIAGVQQGKDAVLAPWSNGPLEGNVNRLKLIKRSMYGRAEIDLLKHRVLYQSKKHRDRKNKRKNHQAQQMDGLKKPKSMQSDTNFQHTTFAFSRVA